MNKILMMSELRKALQLYAQTITDDSTKMALTSIYPTYEELVMRGSIVAAGTVCRYGVNSFGENQLYEFISNYTPVDSYTPDSDITHYKKIGFDNSGNPIWTQPFGATDAYSLNDIVAHKGQIWISGISANVWEPGVSGWSIHSSENEWPDWIQPTGAGDAYNIGDKVTFETNHYICLINANVWSPTTYPAGWQIQ